MLTEEAAHNTPERGGRGGVSAHLASGADGAPGALGIDVGTAELGSPDSGTCYATLDASYSSLSGSGVQHNVGAAHADGYYYKRA